MLIKPISLSDHDPRQMSEEWVSSLTPAQRDELLARALAKLRKSLDRLNQSPANSSKSAPWGHDERWYGRDIRAVRQDVDDGSDEDTQA